MGQGFFAKRMHQITVPKKAVAKATNVSVVTTIARRRTEFRFEWNRAFKDKPGFYSLTIVTSDGMLLRTFPLPNENYTIRKFSESPVTPDMLFILINKDGTRVDPGPITPRTLGTDHLLMVFEGEVFTR